MFDSIEVSKSLEVRIDLPDSEEGRSDAYEELTANSVELCYVKDFGKNHEPSDPRLSPTVPTLKSLSKHAYQTAKSCSTALLRTCRSRTARISSRHSRSRLASSNDNNTCCCEWASALPAVFTSASTRATAPALVPPAALFASSSSCSFSSSSSFSY